MNITDIKAEAPELFKADGVRVRDMLELMFERQYQLELKYEQIELDNGFFVPDNLRSLTPLDLNNAKNQDFLKNAAYRMIEELSEATNTLKNKPWKVTQIITDEVHFIEEMADATHFFIRMWLYIFGNPTDAAEAMYRTYFKKSEVNKFRQESNY